MLKISFRKKLMVGLANLFPSVSKVFLYKLAGADIGKNVRIGRGSYILARNIVLKDGAVIGNGVRIVCRKFVAGEGAKIAEEVRIDGESTCKIGRNCYIGPRAYINAVKPVVLEDNVGMGGRIYTHGVWPPYTEGYPRRFAPVIIEKNAWIPPGTIIFPGVTIGEGAIIGTGAVVTKSVPKRSFAAGVPAKITKSVDEIQNRLSLSQKEARIKEILNDFGRWIKDYFDVEENQEERGHVLAMVVNKKSIFKVQRCGIFYTRKAPTLKQLKSLHTLGNKYSKIVIISLAAIPRVGLSKLDEDSEKFFDWMELENYTCKRIGGEIFLLLRGFIGSHYGIRFSFKKIS